MSSRLETTRQLPLARRTGRVGAAAALLLAAHVAHAFTPPPRINELLAANDEVLVDEDGDSVDWIELYNPHDIAIDLTGFGLSDDPDRPFRWEFEPRLLPPREFLLVYASGKDRQPEPVPAIAPQDLPGLQLWLDADAIQPGNPEHVRSSGGRSFVALWPDASGRGHHARQTQPSLQPELIPGGAQGQSALQFDGLDDGLALDRTLAYDSFCLIAVIQPARPHEIDDEAITGVTGTSGQRYLFGAEHGGDLDAGAGLSAGTNGISAYEHGSGYMPALAVREARLGAGSDVVTLQYEDRRPSLFLAGAPARRGQRSTRRTVFTPRQIGVGAYGAFAGRVAAVLLYDRALADAERRGVEQWLAARAGAALAAALHTNFALHASEERVLLTSPEGRLADAAPCRELPSDVSVGRQPDGTGPWLLFEVPTPGLSNNTPGARDWLAPTEFAPEQGFSRSTVRLVLTPPRPEAEIRYTLDGTEPTPSSPLYRAALSLRGRGSAPDVLSIIPTAGGWQPPQSPGFKAVVVRARGFMPDAIPSEIVTQTYIIDPAAPPRYSLPVFSLVTDPGNFFDADRGIYVPGNSPGGNYMQRGAAWERPLHVTLFQPDGTTLLCQDAAVRIHGGTSRNFPQKNLRLYGREFAGRRGFPAAVFPNLPFTSYDRLLLRAAGHDHHLTFIRDPLMHDLVAEIGLDVQAYQPVIVLLDGEYWGIHNLRESVDGHYLAAHYPGVDPDNVDILEGHTGVNEGSADHYLDMIDFLTRSDIRRADVYAHVRTLMDVENFTDYKIAEIFYYRWDIGNIKYWRPHTPEGRWRWILFDTDVGFGGFASIPSPWDFDMLAYELEPNGPWRQYPLNDHNWPGATFLLRRLMENDTFRARFVTRFADLLNGVFRTERMIARIDALAAVIAPEMPEHIRRWSQPPSMDDWRRNLEALREFARRRPAAARRQLAAHLGLRDELRLRIGISAPHHGALRVNTLESIDLASGSWDGIYFRGIPIEITARPAPGYVFREWEGLPGTTRPDLRLYLNGDFALAAAFDPDPSLAPPAFVALELLDAGRLLITAEGAPDRAYLLENTADFQVWSPVTTLVTDGNGSMRCAVDLPAGELRRFFRLTAE